MTSALIAVFIVSRCCTSLSYKIKIFNSTFARVFAFGFLYLAFTFDDLTVGFSVSLVASVLLGAFTMVDHVVFASYLKTFPSYCLKGNVSGQGFSGMFSTLMYLGMKEINFEFKYACLIMVPTNLLLISIFLWMDKLKLGDSNREKEYLANNQELEEIRKSQSNIEPLLGSYNEVNKDENENENENNKLD